MEMTEQEIVNKYNRAESKSKQIKILAELNACSTQQIKDVLSKNGIKLRGIKTELQKVETHSIDEKIEVKESLDMQEAIATAKEAMTDAINRKNKELVDLGTKERSLIDEIQKLRKSLKTLEVKA